MPNWAAFAAVAAVVCGFLLFLAHATSSTVTTTEATLPTTEEVDAHARERFADHEGLYEEWVAEQGDEWAAERQDRWLAETDSTGTRQEFSTGLLLANVALTQGLFLAVLVGAAILAAVPPAALGVAPAHVGLAPLAVGVAVGLALYAANQVGSSVSARFDIETGEELRALLAPESPRGWAVLLAGVLPLVALFEEFMFRAVLVGALSVGFGVSPWLLAVVSSLAFAVGHGVQGPAGVVITGALGFVLAAVFILTGSLLVVVVAHYLVNALEFVVHEGLGVE
ncbi:CPBP family intramembrane glutamic endopeptidase [Haloarchaeobius amylolyticus]|uniref:CPBP family intramembrane glutamic endopeptidase n=1 Tax=Haloarchaeobius amylolyticus TaxID=1198296 RepID=UPI00226DA2FF|nr:CPBP family intramembrane glutamic endopeptidase [Haloarchaeobius amylolyticus]